MFKKIKNVVIQQLSQGTSVDKISQSLSCGIIIGCFPLIGFTTGLAALAGFLFKLNHVVVQTANYFMYPVQIILIPIYIKLSGYFIDISHISIRPDLIVQSFLDNPILFTQKFLGVALVAIGIWSCLSLVLYFILIKLFKPVISKLIKIKEN